MSSGQSHGHGFSEIAGTYERQIRQLRSRISQLESEAETLRADLKVEAAAYDGILKAFEERSCELQSLRAENARLTAQRDGAASSAAPAMSANT